VHRNNKSAICIQNVPQNLDEDDLKDLFTGCTNVALIQGPKGVTLPKPPGVEDDLRGLFNMYPSFQRESVIINPPQKSGHLEAYVEFLDEREMQMAITEMSGKSNLIGPGKLRLSTVKQQQAPKTFKNRKNETKKCDFVVKLFKLPPDVDEEVLIQDLNQHQLGDYITNVYVARKTLPPSSSINTSTDMAEDNAINLIKLKSLFTDRNRFRSAPDVNFMSATNDGRVSALILFNDPRDVTTAMQMYEAPDDPDLLKFGTFKLRFVPLLDHNIQLHSALARAIPNKIQQAIEKIKSDPEFSNLRLIQQGVNRNEQEIIRISIRGTNILQIYKARTIFDELMKGQIFKFHHPSWVCLFSLSIF
jgi:RNA recognition motif-containing protein